MKNIACGIVLAFWAGIMLSNPASAQGAGKLTDSGFPDFMPTARNLAMLTNPDLAGVELLTRNEINIWAVRDFLSRFENVKNALWFATPKGGFEAYFVLDGYGERVTYDQRGGWLMSVITYRENSLPAEIRSAVKSVHFDFDIVLVEEISTNEGMEYIVFLENRSSIRLVRITPKGEMENVQELDRNS